MFRLAAIAILFFFFRVNGQTQMRVHDIFGRSLDGRGLTLVDWDGYIANPLLKYYVFAPTNAAFPISATLSVNGPRVYFDLPSSVSPKGPRKTVTFTSADVGVPIRLSIFPDRDGLDEDYTLTLELTGSNNYRQINTVPIHVIDQDLQRTNEFPVILAFERDLSGFFTNTIARWLVTKATDDWGYYFADMKFANVPAGSEHTYIWGNNNVGGYYQPNRNSYTGYLLYAYGLTNATHISGGQGSWNGPVQHGDAGPLQIKRSGSYSVEILGNYNTHGWIFLTNDNDWSATGNLREETPDFYSIAHHEIGHALIFDRSHPGFAAVVANRGFTSAAVTNYFGGIVPIDSANHLTNAIDPESGQGAFGHEYYGIIPRKRWLLTKLDLLCAQEVGYTLHPCSALAPLNFTTDSLPSATVGIPFNHALVVHGGIPLYNWEISAGALPPGLALNSFTGALTGIPTTHGTFQFAVRVRDYHESSLGVTRAYSLKVEKGTAP